MVRISVDGDVDEGNYLYPFQRQIRCVNKWSVDVVI